MSQTNQKLYRLPEEPGDAHHCPGGPEDRGAPLGDQHHEGGQQGRGVVSCEISMSKLDAQTTSWAPPGGITPMESTSNQFVNSINPEEPEDVQEDLEKERSLEQGGTWAKGASEEDNRRYKAFLAYMEEKREESRRILREGEEKKRKGREK